MTTYQSAPANGYRLLVTVDTSSQDAANKKSVIQWTISVVSPRNNNFHARVTGSLVIGGVTLWSSTTTNIDTRPSGSTCRVASGTRTYSHRDDGTLSLSVSASIQTNTQGTSWAMPKASLSGTYTAPPISVVPLAPTHIVCWHNNNTKQVFAECSTVAGDILEYQIAWAANTGGGWSGWHRVVSAGTSRRIYIDMPRGSADMRFQARARNSKGWGRWSAVFDYRVDWTPDKMSPPRLEISNNGRTVTITAPVADAYGTPIRIYQVAIRDRDGGSWSWFNCDSNRRYVFTSQLPYVRYEFRVRAQSASGVWDPRTGSDPSYHSTPSSGPYVRVSGVWKKTQIYVRTGGKWRRAIGHSRSKGAWKELI